jgi:hypothetical protein
MIIELTAEDFMVAATKGAVRQLVAIKNKRMEVIFPDTIIKDAYTANSLDKV